MKNYLTLILISLISFISFINAMSSDLIVQDTNNLVKGIYRNIQEMKYNSPSVDIKFEIEHKQKRLNLMDETEVDYYN